MSQKEIQEAARILANQMASKGRLIEAGWVSLRHLVIPKDAPDIQVNEMRIAYMAGAQHLFSSIMQVLSPDELPTDEDLRRMELIHKELEAFRKELELRFGPTVGSS
jgi:hypothetical protein